VNLAGCGPGGRLFGLAAPGWAEERTATALVREARGRGVRQFDTAQGKARLGYGEGRCEAIVGFTRRPGQ